MMKKILGTLLITFMTFSFCQASQAAVITATFNDVPVGSSGTKILDNYKNPAGPTGVTYQGFSWTNFGVADTSVKTAYQYADIDFSATGTHGKVAYGGFAGTGYGASSINFISAINVISARFSGAYKPNSILDITATFADNSTMTKTINLTNSGYLDVDFSKDFKNVASLSFTPNASSGANPDYFGMDNFTYAPVPEPSSMVLGLLGLSSMLGFRRKK